MNANARALATSFHLEAFATGAHRCPGMALARLEGTVAISQFLNYERNGTPVRGGRVRFRGFLSAPCATGA